MTLETLKRLRLVVPGVMILLFLRPLTLPVISFQDFGQAADLIGWARDSALAVLLGAAYHFTRLRNKCLTKFQKEIDDNIRHQLLAPCMADLAIAAAAEQLRRDRRLMNVFYFYIDDNESLKTRSKRVYFNGLFWSSAADLAAISVFGSFVYWAAVLLIDPRPHYMVLAGMLAVTGLASEYWLLPLITARHIGLGNEQLEFILQNYRHDLCDRIRGAIGGF